MYLTWLHSYWWNMEHDWQINGSFQRAEEAGASAKRGGGGLNVGVISEHIS